MYLYRFFQTGIKLHMITVANNLSPTPASRCGKYLLKYQVLKAWWKTRTLSLDCRTLGIPATLETAQESRELFSFLNQQNIIKTLT